MSMFSLFFLLLCGHAVADFALQSEFIAANKSRHNIPKGYDPVRHGPMQMIWPYVLGAHALIHAAAVFVITQSATCAVIEAASHALIDFGKCEKKYGIHADQAMHIALKACYAIYLSGGFS